MKEYTIEITRRGKTTNVNGTLEYLKEYFGYVLECGKCCEHERGNSKINRNPSTIQALVTTLNKAKRNAARDGNPDTYYNIPA